MTIDPQGRIVLATRADLFLADGTRPRDVVPRRRLEFDSLAASEASGAVWIAGANSLRRAEREHTGEPIRRAPTGHWLDFLFRSLAVTPEGRVVLLERRAVSHERATALPLLHLYDEEGAPLHSLVLPEAGYGPVADEEAVLVRGGGALWLHRLDGGGSLRCTGAPWGGAGFSPDGRELRVVAPVDEEAGRWALLRFRRPSF